MKISLIEESFHREHPDSMGQMLNEPKTKYKIRTCWEEAKGSHDEQSKNFFLSSSLQNVVRPCLPPARHRLWADRLSAAVLLLCLQTPVARKSGPRSNPRLFRVRAFPQGRGLSVFPQENAPKAHRFCLQRIPCSHRSSRKSCCTRTRRPRLKSPNS